MIGLSTQSGSPNVRTPLRSYQRRIADAITGHNSLVILPTGAGKTLIACQHILRHQGKTLFLVPTCQLVSQQRAYVERETGLKAYGHKGGQSWKREAAEISVLVATPAALLSLLEEHRLNLSTYSLVIFDEVCKIEFVCSYC
jgi:superfamily II DNA or RNA helicase